MDEAGQVLQLLRQGAPNSGAKARLMLLGEVL